MRSARRFLCFNALWLCCASGLMAAEPIKLVTGPCISPDGKTVAFAWAGEIWTVPISGGAATPLTRSPGQDREPRFSPDGKSIAFVSTRDGSEQIYIMPATGGTARKLTQHSAGYGLEGWYPDGKSLLVSGSRDHFWRSGDRFFPIKVEGKSPEIPLFDAAGKTPALSPDGTKLLFAREGTQWFRKGYVGSQDSQIWLFDTKTKAFTKLLNPPGGALFPVWKPDGTGFYYVGVHNKNFNVREYDLATKNDKPRTAFDDDSVLFSRTISADGSTIVFRHLFDLYSLDLKKADAKPVKIEVYNPGDPVREPIERRSLATATDVAFTNDGLEIAFIAGGDVWVMDTELREPKQVTKTPEEERNVVFTPDGSALLFVSDQGGQSDIWRADRADKSIDWWRNDGFTLKRLTNDVELESDLKFSPEGSKLAFVKGRGDLWVIQPDGNNSRKIRSAWDKPDFDWSPDGLWFVYAEFDDDFNRDIWIAPVDGSREPFNVSRHPDNEDSPVWSPDGKMIAFAGRRVDREVDIYYVYLQETDDQRTSREKTLEKAIDKTKKARASRALGKSAGPAAATKGSRSGGPPAAAAAAAGTAGAGAGAATSAAKTPVKVTIDFDRLPERLHRISIPNSDESSLLWSPDSKRLGFRGTIEGRPGFYTVDIPEAGRPSLVSSPGGSNARWLEEGNQIVWLSAGVPASCVVSGGGGGGSSLGASLGLSRFGGGSPAPSATPDPSAGGGGSGRETQYRFQARQLVNLSEHYKVGFDLAWRVMRDNWYDGNLNNRNWNKIRAKYRDMAGKVPDNESFASVVSLMLGELNGSHLGFMPGPMTPIEPPAAPTPTPTPGPRRGFGGGGGGGGSWSISTAHLGTRFDTTYPGPGLKVRDTIPDSPADRRESKISAGEIILSIDGTKVDISMDLTDVLNGPLDRDIKVRVKAVDGKERDVVIRPISYPAASALLYEKWIKDNRAMVNKLSNGKLGYLHIRGMDFPSFYRFEEELYSAGVGKDGLIIDVRENGGGSTADHLLTVLTQPEHAIAVPRGGGQGYPQDRRVYASWSKPILVLCNQNSFSNAEIFSHAIKTLKRGHLVGVPTAGGVVSTGATRISDLGTLRLPFRGWYNIADGEDMELKGAVPDHVIWPEPGDFEKGVDTQIAKGVEVLLEDVKVEKARPRPSLKKASERPAR